MKRIAFFCIPAHGHTNPMLPVAAELARRGHAVRFYSFREFEARIQATGAQFIACDDFLPAPTKAQAAKLRRASITEMTLADIRTTVSIDGFLDEQWAAFRPDIVYADSVCFWGKLFARKHGVPLVVSTSTFAFNQLSSSYMKHAPGEILGLLMGMPRMSRALKALEPLGHRPGGVLALVQSDNDTDTVVYTSRRFQPYGESFSGRYAFVGPSLFTDAVPRKAKARPLVYVSLGTVLSDRPDFYRACIDAFRGQPWDAVISCGVATDRGALGPLPGNVKVYPRVDQLDALAAADVFITHCGMNSVSESLYMATPMLLMPQTAEQRAVARRVQEMGAGVPLGKISAESIRGGVARILQNRAHADAASACSADFRACSGASGAADFVESAPHDADDARHSGT